MTRPRSLSPYQSAYTATPLPEGGARIEVRGAIGPKAPWGLVLAAPVGLGMMFLAVDTTLALQAAGIALFLSFLFVVARSTSINRFAGRRTRAGAFDVTPSGLFFPQGGFLPKEQVFRLVHRNAQDGVVLGGFVVSSGFAGAAAVAGAHRQAADHSAFQAISHQLEVESGGQVYPLVGSMTEATARAVLHDIGQILGLR